MKKKTLWIALPLCLCLTGGAVGGGILLARKNAKEVPVYPVTDVGMTEYWGDGSQMDGEVRTDKLQNVYLSETQKITKINVKEGQTVKKGDKLLEYDTTLSSIELERKKIDVQRQQLNLEQAKKELERLRKLKPYTPPVIPVEPDPIPDPDPEPEPDPEPTPTPVPDPGEAVEPPYLLSGAGTREDPEIWLWDAGLTFSKVRITEMMGERSELCAVFEVRKENRTKGELLSRWEAVFSLSEEGELIWQVLGTGSPKDEKQEELKVTARSPEVEEIAYADSAVMETAVYEPVYEGEQYTASELNEMRKEQEKQVKELDLSYRMAEVALKKLEKEFSDGAVYASVDGAVTAVLDEETARAEGSPIITVSGSEGGYVIRCAVSELQKEDIQIGSEVTIQSWESGETVPGTVSQIEDVPYEQGYYYGGGNMNASMYPMLIRADAQANFKEYEYVSVQLGGGEEQSGLYVEMPFILTEGAQHFVYVRGEDERLEKREIQTGAHIWGSYLEILSGLDAEELIAFPYGKNIKEGARCKESTVDELYAESY